ncbi:MAG: DUF6968 family protein [Terriglobales bacterium]
MNKARVGTRKCKLGEVIAERELTAVVDGKTVRVQVRIGKPFAAKEGEFLCPYQIIGIGITGIGNGPVRAIAGLDSMQALYLTLQFIGSMLKHDQRTMKIRWNSDTNLGLPSLNMRNQPEPRRGGIG